MKIVFNKSLLFVSVIQWLNKQINETHVTQQRMGTFEMPAATSNFRPPSTVVSFQSNVSQILNLDYHA